MLRRLIGTLIPLAIAVVSAVVMFQLSEPQQLAMIQIPVLARDVDIGELIRADDLKMKPFPASFKLEGLVTDPLQVQGRYALVPMSKDSPVLRYAITSRPLAEQGMVAFPVQVSLATAGQVRPGDLVDVYVADTNQGQTQTPLSSVPPVLEGVRVLTVLASDGKPISLQQDSDSRGGGLLSVADSGGQQVPSVAILALTRAQASILAAHAGKTVVLAYRLGSDTR